MSRMAVSASAVRGRRAGCSVRSAAKIPAMEQLVRYSVRKSKILRDGRLRGMKAQMHVRAKRRHGSGDDFAVGIRCTGSGDFSDGFVKKTNTCTKKRMGSATWKATEKGRSFAKRPGEEESKSRNGGDR